MASNSNSKIIENDVNRSVFALKRCTKGSQHVGNLAVSSIDLALPGDTYKTARSTFFELKPTTDRVATQIKSHDLSVSVPFRTIWKYWDAFISKGNFIVQNGGFNVPYVQNKEDESIRRMPYTTPISILGKMLACFSQSSSNAPSNLNNQLWKVDPTGLLVYSQRALYDGNKQNYAMEEISDNGTYSLAQGGYNLPWWFPRLGKQGVSNGVNFHNHSTSGFITTQFTFLGGKYQTLARTMMSLIMVANPQVTGWTGVTNVNAIGFNIAYYHDTVGGWLNFIVSVLGPNVQKPHQNSISIDSTVASNSTAFKVCVSPNGTYSFGDIVCPVGTAAGYTAGAYSMDSATFLCAGASNNNYNALATAIVLGVFFEHSSLFGYGSLCESMGHHFFEEVRYPEIFTTYSGLTANYYGSGLVGSTLSEYTVTLPCKAIIDGLIAGVGSSAYTSARMSILPYFAFQKVASDRFCLPHNVLSNNSGQDSTVDTSAKYDSPYWRNNMIPTVFFGHSDVDEDVFNYATVCLYNNSGTWEWRRSDAGGMITAVEKWHYVVSAQQLLTVFLDRGFVQELDTYTEFWQKQDQNVTNLITASGYGVNPNGSINAKSFLMAKKLGKMFWFGGTDQLGNKVIENQFEVHDVPCDTPNVIVLAKNNYTLKTEDIVNNGGALNPDGSPRPLGDRTSIVSNQIPTHNQYSAYIPEFAYLIDLHWFSVKTERCDVPQPAVNVTDRLMHIANWYESFQQTLFAVFQTIGDDPVYLGDIKFGADRTAVLGWTNKNNHLKTGYNEYRGEWKNKFARMIVTPHPKYRLQLFAPSLTYGYLMPAPYEYDLHLVDRFGDAFLYDTEIDVFKKTSMTSLNEVGLNL